MPIELGWIKRIVLNPWLPLSVAKSISENILRRYTTIGSAIDTLRNKRVALLDPEKWDDRNDAELMRLYREKMKLANLKALCCTESSETYHHWKVFTQSADGCCVDFEKKPLLRSIKTDDNYFYAPMDYVRLDEMQDGCCPSLTA